MGKIGERSIRLSYFSSVYDVDGKLMVTKKVQCDKRDSVDHLYPVSEFQKRGKKTARISGPELDPLFVMRDPNKWLAAISSYVNYNANLREISLLLNLQAAVNWNDPQATSET